MKLTGTNPSIGLILPEIRSQGQIKQSKTKTNNSGFPLGDLVAMARGNTPDPIPNSAVKTLSADGTAS